MNDYYKNLPAKRMGSGALIFNDRNELLIVKPTYKDHWSVPGGTVDQNESPKDACIREVKEEIDIDLPDVDFLCVDYISNTEEKSENLQFVFYAGILDDEDIAKIKLDPKELGECRFVSTETATTMLGQKLAARLPRCIEAIKNKKGLYLEQGK
jgi:ADP-ribose pyrophosphatase YjhB (NUDIX family)